MKITGWEEIVGVAQSLDASEAPSPEVFLRLARLVLAFQRHIVSRPIKDGRTGQTGVLAGVYEGDPPRSERSAA